MTTRLRFIVLLLLLAIVATLGQPSAVGGGKFTSPTCGKVDTYTTSGTPLNTSFVTGLSQPYAVAVAGESPCSRPTLWGLPAQSGEYDAATGAPIAVPFLPGLVATVGLAVSDADLYVLNKNGVIGEYADFGFDG